MFRLEKDGALINRYGFNSKGSADLETRLLSRKQLGLCNNGLLGINLGKNKNSKEECHSDYIEGVKLLGKFADYLVINVSSPNTPNLRDLQKRGALEGLLSEVGCKK